MENVASLNTTGRIATKLAKPIHRIEYVLSTRPHIKPSAYAGQVRLYDREAVAQIHHELNAIDAVRSARKAAGQC